MRSVKNQYERFPYPRFSWLGTFRKSSVKHASFETGAKIITGKEVDHAHKDILLLGCGTNEALAFASAHPRAALTAVDLSAKAIQVSKLRCRIRGYDNLKYFVNDAVAFGQGHPAEYDFIHCYGVLHHLRDPQAGFRAIKRMLKPHGFARIMVYSKAARERISLLQKALRLMNYDFLKSGFQKEVFRFARTLPWTNPSRLTFEMHPEVQTPSGLVDAFLHTQETSFSLEELKNNLSEAGLYIGGWDFSENILSLLKEAMGNSIEEKIEMLEAFDQWPTHFTFWVSPKPTIAQKINVKPQ